MRNWLINLLKSALFAIDPQYYKGPTFVVTPKGVYPKKHTYRIPIKSKALSAWNDEEAVVEALQWRQKQELKFK